MSSTSLLSSLLGGSLSSSSSSSSIYTELQQLIQAFEAILQQLAAGSSSSAADSASSGDTMDPSMLDTAGTDDSADTGNTISGVSGTAGTSTSGASDVSGLGGANATPDRFSSASDAAALVDKVAASGGGTVRMQMSHDEINNSSDMAKLDAMIKEGDKDGVKIQFTFRDNDNGGGGNTLSGSSLSQAEQDETNVIDKYKNDDSFELDTINESGQHTNEDWYNEQAALVKNAMNSGLAGNKIIVEDSEWGSGEASGSGDSGLVTYAKQLLAIDPEMTASFHEYGTQDASTVASNIEKEVEDLHNAGYTSINQGEYGNAGWSGSGDGFSELNGVSQGEQEAASVLKQYNVTSLPWYDQFVNGTLTHGVGWNGDSQVV